MYEPYPEEVLKEGREMPEGYLPYDGRFVTVRFHVGNNCKCQFGNTHPGHHQAEPPPPETGDTEEATGRVHGKHKHKHDEY